MTLPDVFLQRPLAHRGLHDRANGRPENSMEAIEAAISSGYGIEIDLQRASDGVPMVFHDYDLSRLTDQSGSIALHSSDQLHKIMLSGGKTGIPTLTDVLSLVAGRVPLLIEIKDQDGAMGPDTGPLEIATAEALRAYLGPVAVMSFNPHSMRAFTKAAPDIPIGLTTCSWLAEDWPTVPKSRREQLATLHDVIDVGASFISHDVTDLGNPAVTALKGKGMPVLCWTVRSPDQEKQARQIADNITFEGYAA
ncbi:MAG: phosphodiesterase [Marivivens sp.]|nr:phosphodiesterase [Marivivens sp.]